MRLFYEDELRRKSYNEMYQIAVEEKLVDVYLENPTREELINILLKFRGARPDYSINKYNENELILHKFGYYESSSKEYYDEKILDLIIVPGIGFDYQRNRIGFGGGFYDNFLTKVRKMKKEIVCVAVCYDFQIVEKVPTEEHDVRVDAVVSEKRVIEWNKKIFEIVELENV